MMRWAVEHEEEVPGVPGVGPPEQQEEVHGVRGGGPWRGRRWSED